MKKTNLSIRPRRNRLTAGIRNLVRETDLSPSHLILPLFVIDGIPMVNNRGGQPSGWDGVDGGDGLSAINMDDIETMTVLKGANAAILYGSQGANGVVIITTKSGKEGNAVVQINSSVQAETIQRVLTHQAHLQIQADAARLVRH